MLELQSDTAAMRATVTTSAGFTLSASRETGLTRIRGTLDSFSTQTNGRIVAADPPLAVPLAFTGRLVAGGFHLDSLNGQAPGTGDCRNPGLNNLSPLRQSLVAVPLTLAPGTAWVDSSTVTVCSGSVPLQLSAVKSYRVSGEGNRNGAPVIIIDRTDRFTASGEGTQGQHRVTVTTRGSGSAKVYVDRTTGFLNSSEGEQQAQVTITASGRTQAFIQTVKEQTVVVD